MKHPQYDIAMRAVEAYAVTRATLILRPSRRNSERVDAARGAVERALDLLIEQAVAAPRTAEVETVETGQAETTTALCRNGHDWIRYTLDDSPASYRQRDGIDDQGRPYCDVQMMPKQAFAYATTVGSNFATRVVGAACCACGAKVTSDC